MKTFFLILAALNVAAQNAKSGVYKTLSDYNDRKLSYEIDCKIEKHAIKTNEFLNESYITVKYNDHKIKLQKDSIFGILNCDEPLIRFQSKTHFYLAEAGSIWIFYKETSVAQGKGFNFVREYYFSLKGDGKLIELTIRNIKLSFPDNHTLHDMIDAQFQNNPIAEYDTFHKMFKINHIIKASNTVVSCPTHSDVIGKEDDKCAKCGADLKSNK